jgi:cell division protein ZapA
MALVTVKIGGFQYTVGCEDGQESHLQSMAAEVERRIETARPMAGGNDSKLLALAALMLADEIHDLKVELRNGGGTREVVREVIREVPVVKEVVKEVIREVPVEVHVPVHDSLFADRLDDLARRAEDIAAGLEHA